MDKIIIETPREKNSEEARKSITQFQKTQEKQRDDIKETLKSSKSTKIPKKSIDKYLFYKEQDGKCIYSGKTIDLNRMLSDSSYTETDHIIPKTISFDDSKSNKVLTLSKENQEKKNKSPYEYLKGNDKNIK